MTATPERSQGAERTDEVLSRMDAYLGERNERFRLEELEQEFAFYTQRLGTTGLYLADTTVNAVSTFKLRGAINKLAKEKEEKGETAARLASQGSHLLGGVYAARLLDMELDGYVPVNASPQKLRKARDLQPDTSMFRLHKIGVTLEESMRMALENDRGVFVHPFDDPDVHDGQGTVANDLHATASERGISLDHVVLPIGGNGVFTAVAKKLNELDPHITVHGVESQGNNSLTRSLEAGQRVEISSPNLRYGGAAVKKTGALGLHLYQQLPNVKLWKVRDEEVERLIDEHLQERVHRQLDHPPLEPTSLVAVAALEKIIKHYPGETIAVVGTGRNAPLENIWR